VTAACAALSSGDKVIGLASISASLASARNIVLSISGPREGLQALGGCGASVRIF